MNDKDETCQHNSQEIIHDNDYAEIALCTWTCGELLINFKQDEDGHQWRIPRLRQLSMNALEYVYALSNDTIDVDDRLVSLVTAVSEGALK